VLKRLHLISSCALVLLGAVHTSLTPVLVGRFSMGAMYFASAGLALMLLGFLNLALRSDSGTNRVLRTLCHAANILMTVFAVFAVLVIPEPQAYFGLAMLITQTLSAFALTTTAAPARRR
jgi:hypothetical protein